MEVKESNVEQKPREYFWDTIIIYVAFLILNLAAADFAIEFVRDNEIVCFSAANSSFIPEIRHLCATNVPSGAYISIFVVFHGLILLASHHLWRNSFEGSFRSFFRVVSKLKKRREYETGTYATMNINIVEDLEDKFKSRIIFQNYILKLIFQLIWAIGGFIFAAAFFYQKFGPFFNCYTSENEWNINSDVTCVYEILTFLEILWILELVLLFIIGVTLIWALLWCFQSHPSELGSLPIATFSYHYGLSSKYYTTQTTPSHCNCVMRFLFYIAPVLERIIYGGPHIVTSLDFMVMKLFNTDRQLGYVFKESQISHKYNKLCADDQRRLKLHVKKQRNLMADDSEDQGVIYKTKDTIADNDDLMWKFSKQCRKFGIYSDFQMLGSDYPVVLPGTIRGTVLGFSSRAPHNASAIEVSFCLPNFTTSLARIFKQVTAVRFTPDCKQFNTVLSANTHTRVITCPQDILALDNFTTDEFMDHLRKTRMQPGSRIIQTSFIVVGPIPECGGLHTTTVDYFLEAIGETLCKDAVLLVVRPLKIFSQDVSNAFVAYQPPKSRFEPLEQTYDVIHRVQEWVARKSTQLQSPHNLQSPGRKQYLFRLHVASGNISAIVECTTYRYIYMAEQSTNELEVQSPSLQKQEVTMSASTTTRETNI